MLKCRNCEYAKEIREITKTAEGENLARENCFYYVFCLKSGIPERCNFDQDVPEECELKQEQFENTIKMLDERSSNEE